MDAGEIKKLSEAFEKHAYDDLSYFGEIREMLRRIEEKTDAQSVVLEDQANTLAPIANTFNTASTLGRWLMPLLVAVSLMVGIVRVSIQIVSHKFQ